MSQQQLRLLFVAVVIVCVIGVVAMLGRQSGPGEVKATDSPQSEESGSRKGTHGRLGSSSGAGLAGAKVGSKSPEQKRETKIETLETTTGVGRDGVTSVAAGSQPPDQESETRERLRFEEAQRNAFKPRKTDPEKIQPAPLGPSLDAAASKYKVPKELLAALMYAESEGTHRDAAPSIDAGFGVMNLRENNIVNTLRDAAQLIGASEEDCIYNQRLNIEAASALLARYHDDALATGVSDGEAWYMAISQYSGRPDPELASELADQVAAAMMRGFEVDGEDGGGKYTLPANPNPIFTPKDYKRVGMDSPSGQPVTPTEGQQPGAGAPAQPTPTK